MEIKIEIIKQRGEEIRNIKIKGVDYNNKLEVQIVNNILSKYISDVEKEVGRIVTNIEFETLSQEKQKS